MRRAVVALVGAVAVLLPAGPAQAHAVLVSSSPPAGSSAESAPAAVRLTFSEHPEPRASSVVILNAAGTQVASGSGVAPDDPLTLSVATSGLANGSYTISWRVLSRVDGHLTAGSLSFGVGEPAQSGEASAAMPKSSPIGTAGRVPLYAGLIVLLGGSAVAAVEWSRISRRALLRLLRTAWLAAMGGVALLATGQARDSALGLTSYLQTSVGRAAAGRAVAVSCAGLSLLLAARMVKGRVREALAFTGGACAAAVWIHVASGHAAAQRSATAAVAIQVAHVLAAGLWIGGLAAIAAGVRSPGADASASVRRFSTIAGMALVVVVVTGTLRAVDEVGSWDRLTGTFFGRLVLAKVCLLVLLALLGAMNRYRHAPRASSTLTPLRRTSVAELSLAAVVVVVTALLASNPPASVADATPASVTVSGTDFGTAVRARLRATPGFPGTNEFVLTLTDADSRQPFTADEASLRFSLSGRSDLAPATLDLQRQGPGRFTAPGATLSIQGRWQVLVTARRGIDTFEIPLALTTRQRPQQVDVVEAPGQPALHTVTLEDGSSVQVYADPQRPGPAELHVTFFNPRGGELAVGDVNLRLRAPGAPAAEKTPVRVFGPGHVVADVTLTPGSWAVEVNATAATGPPLAARLSIRVGP
ncbi:MAG TPA: copper resistance protein CopC [Actinomycetota bacterium]|nr:copper resistance protein CopC [Actinomycetota bacterium]